MYANADECETHTFYGASYLMRTITIWGHVSIKHSRIACEFIWFSPRTYSSNLSIGTVMIL